MDRLNQDRDYRFSSLNNKRIQALSMAEKVKNLEVMAEQILNWLSPNSSKRTKLQFLLFFELSKVYFNLRAFFHNDNTCLLYETNQAVLNITRKKEEILEEKKNEVMELSENEKTKSQSAANMSRKDVIKRIERILGVKKIKMSKRERMEKLEGDGKGGGVETRELEMVKEVGEEDEEEGKPEFKYVRSEESRFDKLKFNLSYVQQHPRTKSSIPVIKTIPIDHTLIKSKRVPLRVKISEILRIVRPVLHCISIIMHKKPKFRTLFFSLILDAIIILLRVCYEGHSLEERREIRRRNFQLLYIYLFRQPLWDLFTRPVIVEPILNKFVKIDFVKNLILQALEFRSSFSISL